MFIKMPTLITFLVMVSLSLTGCTKSDFAKKESSEKTNEVKEVEDKSDDLPVYSVAMSTSYPPFEYIGDNGEIVGFDVDLVKAVAEKANIKLRIEPYTFRKLLSAIKEGKEDMSASAIFITDERKETLEYSDPYFTLPMYIAGLNTDDRPHDIEEIKNKKIAMQDNFLLNKIAQEIFVPQNNEIITEKTNYLAFQQMYSGKADFVLENIMSIEGHAKLEQGKPLFYIRLPEDRSIKLGYITQKGNHELAEKLNEGIRAVKADGTYDKIYNKWFGDLEAIIQKNSI